jgi:hypothetical protein
MRAIAATRQQSYFFFVISMKSQGFSFQYAWEGDSASRPSMGIWLIGATGARPVNQSYVKNCKE